MLLPVNRQPGAGRPGTTETAQSSLPPTSSTASGPQTLVSLPEVRSTSLHANRQPGAEAPANLKKRVWVGNKPVCPVLPSSTSTPSRAKTAAKMLQTFPAKGTFSIRTVC
jgi:hypothetical protein